MALNFQSLLKILPSKKKPSTGGSANTPTFDPNSNDRVLTAPLYRDHLTDVFASRQSDDSRTLLNNLFKNDPDVSAAVFSYLTMANTDPLIIVRDLEGEIDRDATRDLHKGIALLTRTTDYTQGFQLKKPLTAICEELRYMSLLRGGMAAELILDKNLSPVELRNVDLASIVWFEKASGLLKPAQTVLGESEPRSLDISNFFVSFFRRDPTAIYSTSPFVSSINTIAARQQVINDLYRIMNRTGFPRMSVKITEEVLIKNAPMDVRVDSDKLKAWINARMVEIRGAVENLRVDQAFIHSDAVEPRIFNEKNPGIGINIGNVIETLNAQNQAGLKTMSTVIGRGVSGVNTGSVEARIAAMNADELNYPVASLLQNVFTYQLHSQGYAGFVEVNFKKAELRPELELEPQLALRAARLRRDLSSGLITDDEFHMMMYNRIRPESSPILSGTGFETPTGGVEVDAEKVSPNGDPLGRSMSGEGSPTP